jgi:glycosyltransferase involved in cell wall biosynthesis
LVLGAGIKVKVLEGMSAGLPVITNEIGIEGIDAVDGKDYIYAEKPEEYAAAIEKLLNDKVYRMSMSVSAKEFLAAEFNLETNMKKFLDVVGE